MRVALAQIASSTDPAANLSIIGDQTRKATLAGADLIVFPEAAMASFSRQSSEVAEPIDGPWAKAVTQIARDAGISLVAGMFTTLGARVRNTALAVTSTDVVTYDKIHLFDAFGFHESDQVDPGDRLTLVQLGDALAGLAICYDIRFPGIFTAYARLGAGLMIVPASWGQGSGKLAQWRTLAVARALDSTAFVLACGQADPRTTGQLETPADPTGVGHSMVIGPLGTIIAEADAAPELLVTDIDLEEVSVARRCLPVLVHDRFASSATGSLDAPESPG